jgi:hypothetical protein
MLVFSGVDDGGTPVIFPTIEGFGAAGDWWLEVVWRCSEWVVGRARGGGGGRSCC